MTTILKNLFFFKESIENINYVKLFSLIINDLPYFKNMRKIIKC